MFNDITGFQRRAISELGIRPENLSRAESELCLDVSGVSSGVTWRNIVSITLYENGYGNFFATRLETRNGKKQYFRKTAVTQFNTEQDAIEYIKKEFL